MSRDSRSPEGEDRLSRWVREHGPAVYGFLRRRLGDAAMAEDLTQETFCRAWESRSRYSEEGKERAYLLRIADRLAQDAWRRSRKESPQEASAIERVDPAGTPDETLVRKEAERQLSTALESLSEPQRRTLLLRYYGQMEFAEIAQQLDCPLGTALSHCRRGLQTLRKLLTESSR